MSSWFVIHPWLARFQSALEGRDSYWWLRLWGGRQHQSHDRCHTLPCLIGILSHAMIRKHVVAAICDVACHSLKGFPTETAKLVAEHLQDKSVWLSKAMPWRD